MSAQIPFEKQFLYDAEQGFPEDDRQNTSETVPEFEALIDYLKQSRGCDLSSYKRSSLMRRFKHRMQKLGIETFQGYLQHLKSYSEEYLELLDDVLINVTSFFRDRDVWDYLAAEIIPKIIASKQPRESIRVWSAGCAAGQELYSVLILLAEALGLEACLQRVQCFATDADESALSQARQATYSPLEVEGIPEELLKKYFALTPKGYIFHPKLRRTVVFAHHDLTQDAPISRIDLLTCRNVLIYFNSDAQEPILIRFHFALKPTGFLVLGKSEALVHRRPIFTPIDSKHRVYRKGAVLKLADHLSITPKRRKTPAPKGVPLQSDFWEAAFETSSVAHLAIDANGCLLHANEQARLLFGLTLNDLKRPLQELELAQLINFSLLTKALCTRHNSPRLKNVEWTTAQGTKQFEIELSRVMSNQGHVLGAILTFVETTHHQQLAAELDAAHSQLARVLKALDETKSELKTAQGELKSAQKELEVLQQEMSFLHQDQQS